MDPTITTLISSLRLIEGDVRVVCIDEEFTVSGTIVSARCAPLKRMLYGTFREGKDKIIEFKTRSGKLVRHFMAYLQWADLPGDDVPISELADLLEMADEYIVDELRDKITERLTALAKNLRYAFHVFGLPDTDLYKGVKDVAFATIKTNIGATNGSLICSKCSVTSKSLQVACTTCKKFTWINAETNKCGCGAPIVFGYIKCPNYIPCIYVSRSVQCTGFIDRESGKLGIDGIPDETLAKALRMIHGL